MRSARSLHRDETDRGVAAGDGRRGTRTPRRAQDMLRQADVIDGATVLPAAHGKRARAGRARAGGPRSCCCRDRRGRCGRCSQLPRAARARRRLRCACAARASPSPTPSVSSQPAIAPYAVDLTLLAAPGDVEVVLFAARRRRLRPAGRRRSRPCARSATAATRLTAHRSPRPSSARPSPRARIIVTAESCTGGMVAAALTDVPGVLRRRSAGGVVAYANEVKMEALGVPAGPACAVRRGERGDRACNGRRSAPRCPGSTISVAVTGIAGPDGGTADKPVGLVWFALARADGRVTAHRRSICPAIEPPYGAGPTIDRTRPASRSRSPGRVGAVPRAFLAIALPIAVRSTLAACREAFVAADPEWRGEKWVAEANLHVTLRFLGSVPEPAVPLIARCGPLDDRGPIEPYQLRLDAVRRHPAAALRIARLGRADRGPQDETTLACRAHRSRHVVPRVRARGPGVQGRT